MKLLHLRDEQCATFRVEDDVAKRPYRHLERGDATLFDFEAIHVFDPRHIRS